MDIYLYLLPCIWLFQKYYSLFWNQAILYLILILSSTWSKELIFSEVYRKRRETAFRIFNSFSHVISSKNRPGDSAKSSRLEKFVLFRKRIVKYSGRNQCCQASWLKFPVFLFPSNLQRKYRKRKKILHAFFVTGCQTSSFCYLYSFIVASMLLLLFCLMLGTIFYC